MEAIQVDGNPDESRLQGRGVFERPIWTAIHAAVRKHRTFG